MNTEKLSPLQEAARLIRIQEFKDALEILTSHIRQNPELEEAWFLLSFALQDPQRKQECIERVILINPNNTRAKERLAKITGKSDHHAESEKHHSMTQFYLKGKKEKECDGLLFRYQYWYYCLSDISVW